MGFILSFCSWCNKTTIAISLGTGDVTMVRGSIVRSMTQYIQITNNGANGEQGSVALTRGSVPRRTIFELRQFD